MAVGRPRTFDTDNALDKALQVFWRRGYEGASLSDLTKAMGISPPSLYAAFGNKEALFRRALDRYAEERASFRNEAFAASTAYGAIERLLRGTADFLANRRNPLGCLLVQAALTCGEAADPIRRELNAQRAAGEAEIRRRLERAKSENELPADTDPADLARYIATVLQGMAVQAAGGASRKDLYRIAEMAMGAWPDGGHGDSTT